MKPFLSTVARATASAVAVGLATSILVMAPAGATTSAVVAAAPAATPLSVAQRRLLPLTSQPVAVAVAIAPPTAVTAAAGALAPVQPAPKASTVTTALKPTSLTPAATKRPAAPPATRSAARAAGFRASTGWQALNTAISRIPGYGSAAPVNWVISSHFGHFGMTDWYHNTIYLSPSIPVSLLTDVARHEYGHILQARAYHGDIARMITSLNRVFGGGGRGNLNGAERAADCIAILNGAQWTHYTACDNPAWRDAAQRIIEGREV